MLIVTGGRLADEMGRRRVFLAGAAGLALGPFLLSRIDLGSGYAALVAGMLAPGIGQRTAATASGCAPAAVEPAAAPASGAGGSPLIPHLEDRHERAPGMTR